MRVFFVLSALFFEFKIIMFTTNISLPSRELFIENATKLVLIIPQIMESKYQILRKHQTMQFPIQWELHVLPFVMEWVSCFRVLSTATIHQ